MRNYERYCENYQDIENYELAKAANFVGWQCHHRLETHNSDGERRLVDISKEELIALDMYYHRPASELIFMLTKEHYLLHFKGKKCGPYSEERKRKMSKARKGKPTWNKGIPMSGEQKKKISNTLTSVTELYREYKVNGGNMSWNDFRKNNGDKTICSAI